MSNELIYKGVNLNTTPNDASLVNYTDNKSIGASTVQEAIDAVAENINGLIKVYDCGTVSFGTGSGDIYIAYTDVPSTACVVSAIFDGYSSSYQLKVSFSIIKATSVWDIGYNNASGVAFDAKVKIYYI